MNNKKKALIKAHNLKTDKLHLDSMQVITFLVSRSDYSRFKAVAIRRGLSPDFMLRQAVNALSLNGEYIVPSAADSPQTDKQE